MVAETPSKLTRPIPFTPKRPISSVSGSSTDLSSRLSRLTTPGILSSTHKKYKAPLSSESRSRILPKAKPVLPTVPGTPANTSTSSDARPRTPGTPGRKSATDSPLLMPSTSEMDVSHIDPEEVLVDFQTVEPGDISGEMDEAWLRAADLDHVKTIKSWCLSGMCTKHCVLCVILNIWIGFQSSPNQWRFCLGTHPRN